MNSTRSIKDEMGEAEWAARVELAAAYRVFDMLGWTHLIHTHITAGVPGETDHYLINPYGLLWEEITASSLIKVDAGGKIVHQGSTDCPINPAGFKIHSALHTSERAAEWVMHAHVPEVNAVANLEGGLIRGLSVYSMDIGGISYHDFQHATSSSSDACSRMIEDLGLENKVLLLPNHGAITLGKKRPRSLLPDSPTGRSLQGSDHDPIPRKFAKRLLGGGRTNRGRDLPHRPEQLYGK